MDAQKSSPSKMSILAISTLILVVVGIVGTALYRNRDMTGPAVVAVQGDTYVSRWCEFTQEGLTLSAGNTVTVTELVQKSGSEALKRPKNNPTTDAEREQLNREKPYYIPALFLSLTGQAPDQIKEENEVVRQVMQAAQDGDAPEDFDAALSAARTIDAFIAKECV